jgi:hypothetical protein
MFGAKQVQNYGSIFLTGLPKQSIVAGRGRVHWTWKPTTATAQVVHLFAERIPPKAQSIPRPTQIAV